MPDFRDGMEFHKWITQDGACDACLELEGIHAVIPQRPHPHCQCRVVSYNTKPAGGECLWSEPLPLNFQTSYYYGDEGMEPATEITSDDEGNPTEATYFGILEVLCPDATIIQVTVEYHDTDRHFDQVYQNPDDLESFAETVEEEMHREALELAKQECPRCGVPAQF